MNQLFPCRGCAALGLVAVSSSLNKTHFSARVHKKCTYHLIKSCKKCAGKQYWHGRRNSFDPFLGEFLVNFQEWGLDDPEWGPIDAQHTVDGSEILRAHQLRLIADSLSHFFKGFSAPSKRWVLKSPDFDQPSTVCWFGRSFEPFTFQNQRCLAACEAGRGWLAPSRELATRGYLSSQGDPGGFSEKVWSKMWPVKKSKLLMGRRPKSGRFAVVFYRHDSHSGNLT